MGYKSLDFELANSFTHKLFVVLFQMNLTMVILVDVITWAILYPRVIMDHEG